MTAIAPPPATARTLRPAARILLVDGRSRVLLFRFTPADRPPFWVTPGGALEPGEGYPAAARRELREEVGIDRDCGPEVACRVVDFLTIEGVEVTADERYFRVDVDADAVEVDPRGHTDLERRVMLEWRWFERAEIARHDEPVFPIDLAALLAATDSPKEPIMNELTRVALPTGVELDVRIAGDEGAPAMILLHGFPESHRTWRHIVPDLARDHRVVVPDQRGYAGSSKPSEIADYAPDRIVADLLALTDHLGIDQFTLVGHDWGGAVAWMAALQHPGRITRLVIVNAPHPLVFQRTLFDDPAQRAASQYITAFRSPTFERYVDEIGLSAFFDASFARHAGADPAALAAEKPIYLAQWAQPGALTAMLNWYRASQVQVPAPGEAPPRPAFLDAPFPPLRMPVLVVWGTGDIALLPIQLDGLGAYIPDLTVERVEAGHFVPWQNPQAVIAAMRRWGI